MRRSGLPEHAVRPFAIMTDPPISSIRDVEALRHACRRGLSVEFLFFWGHQPLPDGSVGTSCLSQWWPSEFTVEGVTYPSAEHFMMAEKARLFGDDESRARILSASHPRSAKRIGRGVRNFDDSIWCEHRFEIAVRGNVAKFSRNDGLREFLASTENRVIVEASPVDRIWGIGLAADAPDVEDPEKWRGLNLLGFALMECRDRLRPGGRALL